MKQPRTTQPMALLASLTGVSQQLLEREHDKLLDSLGMDSLTATRVRGALQPMPSYQVLYGLTVAEVAERLALDAPADAHTDAGGAPQDDGENETGTTFILTPMQESYVIGASQDCPCQVYTEFDIAALDVPLFQEAVRLVVARHPMLHADIVNGTRQAILPVAERRPQVSFDAAAPGDPALGRAACMAALQEPGRYWDIRLTRLDAGTVRVHLLLDMLFIDATSAMLLLREVADHYHSLLRHGVAAAPQASALGFRDYCDALAHKQSSQASLDYWNERCAWMPGPPQLPRLKSSSSAGVDFRRAAAVLDQAEWSALKARAGQLHVTPNALLLAAFAEVLRLYAEEAEFSLTVTMSERPVARDNDYSAVVGEFTNILLCPITARLGEGMFERAVAIHRDLGTGLEHGDVSGLEVTRMLRRHRADPHLVFPTVFTSFLGIVRSDLELAGCSTTLHYQQTQTPQITLDHQVYELHGALHVNWDYDANVYGAELMTEMLACFTRLLGQAAAGEESPAALPPHTLALRQAMNETAHDFGPAAPQLLHALVMESAARTPQATAVIDGEVVLSYGELADLARATAVRLQIAGIGSGVCVAVVMEKGWEQVVATVGILLTGGFYLPLNPSDPDERIRSIMSLAGCTVALTQQKCLGAERDWYVDAGGAAVTAIVVERAIPAQLFARAPAPVEIDPAQLAYVIFTSGSTGQPKGVEIAHGAAANTCLDINARFGHGPETVTFAISSLSFDLSVWDIFGVLGAGGTVVVCKPDGTRDPDYWWQQLTRHGVTVWNTVPTSFAMLVAARAPDATLPLRTAMLSGDAIAMGMVQEALALFPHLNLVALGGATEASIWSNYHIVTAASTEHGTELVPYGRALSNQTIMVLDARLAYRPDGVVGDIYIGGVGVARGYFRALELTASKFIEHPAFGRLYATGDLGRYLPNGEIEIVGRKDSQVKVGGHRVELAEIEHCAEGLPGVRRAAVVHLPSAAGARVVGFVTASGEDVDPTGLEEALRRHVEQNLPDYMSPQSWTVLDEIPLTANSKVDAKRLRHLAMAAQVQAQEAQPGENSSEVALILQLAAQVLDVPVASLSASTSLVEQGLSSLFAVQLINLLAKAWNTRLSYTLVFNYPSALALAAYRTGTSSTARAHAPAAPVDAGEPIAIVGMACRLPGGVTSPGEFWAMLHAGTDCMEDVPAARFDIDEIYDADPAAVGRSYSRRGAFMDKVESFDHEFFGISLAEARSMDPQQRVLLEVSYEALHGAGYDKDKLRGSSTGVFMGQMNYDWLIDFGHVADFAGTGVSPSITANRVSFTFDLAGPSMTIDTACSSSLVAVDAAVTKLRSGACRMALAGGANLILSHQPYVTTCQARMLSVDSRCATFDSAANGIARGEGVGAVVLKRLSDALADGDQVLAVIRGSAVNQDGRSASMTAPSGHAQEAVIRQALAVAGLEGRDVDYIECHGTGTPLGDPIEVEAIKNVLGAGRDKSLVLGAVKTNIGHLEGAAGIVGLIKVVEVLRRRKAPGNLHFKSLNPAIDMSGFAAVIATAPVGLGRPGDKSPLVGAVSSFGFGGTNAHAVLESWEGEPPARPASARDAIWMFTGQGSLQPGAARALYEAVPSFRAALERYTALLADSVDLPLLGLLVGSSDADGEILQRTEYAQPALVALQLAQMEMWRARGLRPAVVLGHSVGEFPAAVAAGVMGAEDALRLAALRGKLMAACAPGAMAAVFAPAAALRAALPEGVVIAAENGPTMTVLASPHDALARHLDSLADGHTMLAVSHAFHSPMMAPAAAAFREAIAALPLAAPRDVRFVSTLSGQAESARLCDPDYWAEQILQPVRFLGAVQAALALQPQAGAVIELGPTATLINLAQRIAPDVKTRWVASSLALDGLPPERLFRYVPLPWEKPVWNKQAATAAAPRTSAPAPADSVYESSWVPAVAAASGNEVQGDGLLLSHAPLGALPQGWHGVVPAAGTDLAALLAERPWSNVVLAASNDAADVALGLKLLQLAGADAPPQPGQLVFATAAGNEMDAALWGLARTARIERPDLRLRCIEYGAATAPAEMAARLPALAAYPAEEELAVGADGAVQVARLRRATLGAAGRLALQLDATYVVSGGTGALGLVVARLLVERGARHLLLLSRGGEHPAATAQLAELRELARIECRACDVADLSSVTAARDWLLGAEWPAVRGVVHTAGVLSDGTLPNQSADKLALAFGAKVDGARNLRAAFAPPDFLVLFSSIAAVFGSAAQASYAAANAALDGLAAAWSRAGENVLSIQWGAWSDAGMAVRADAVRHAQAAGWGAVSNALATTVLEQLLASNKRGTVLVSPVDWARLNIRSTRFALLAESKDKLQEGWSRAALQQIVRECLLQFLAPADAEGNPSFMEAGLSSLDLVQFRQQLLARVPSTVDLPVHFAFNYPTEQDVADHLFEQLKARQPEAPAPADTSVWTLLNGRTSGTPLFLVSGVMGTVDKTFGVLAAAMPTPVYAVKPGIPAVIDPASFTLESLAAELREAMEREVPGRAYSVGGLSFGAALAFEMGLQLERQGKLARVVMFDPRHLPPFTAPSDAAPFEQLLERYEPAGPVGAPVLVFQCAVPPIERQSAMMRETSRSFLDDAGVLERCRAMCPAMELIHSDGHHFNLLNKHAGPIAARLKADLAADVTANRAERPAEPIAIIGSACRLPGDVASPDAFWEMLLAGTDCVTDVPSSRFDIDEVYHPDPDRVGSSYTRRGAFVGLVETFDHDFFGISVAEARAMDPQQRMLMEVAYDAFHDAGYDKARLRGSATSVHVGLANDDWTTMGRDHEAHSPHFGAGVSGSIASNRISYLLGLTGPSMTLDTACSSSLVAVDLAVEKLRSGICSVALVGGVNVMLHHRMFVSACATKALSKAGRCATFDAAADGYCRGEGAGAVVLKRLGDALAEGDAILAVIRGTAVNQDGRSVSLTAPNGLAQEAVVRQALKVAGLDGRDIDYVECHGTGTPLGDPIEVAALKTVLGEGRDKPVVLGAVKTNIGHLEGAAGVVGLIKAVEVLRRRTAPGNAHFTTLNPNIDLEGFPALIPNAPVALGQDGAAPLRAGVSSFGFGGTNAHVVLESFGAQALERRPRVAYAPRFLPWRRLPHPFLGRKVDGGFGAPLAARLAAMWNDHRIGEQVLVPAASHITLIGGAALLRHGAAATAAGVEVRDLVMPRPLVVSGDGALVRCLAEGAGWRIAVERNGALDGVAQAAEARLLDGAGRRTGIQIDAAQARCAPADADALYRTLASHGVQFGPGYRNLHDLRMGEDEAIARVRVAHTAVEDRALTLLHPATLDAGIQMLGLCAMKTCGVCVPFSVTSARLYTLDEQPAVLWAHARVGASNARSVEGTVTLFGDSGEVHAVLEGLSCRQAGVDSQVNDSLFETEWAALPPTQTFAGPQGRQLLLTRVPLQASLPPSWRGALVDPDSDLPALLAEGWDSVALLGHGAEEDVALGLRLSQALVARPAGAAAIGQTVFVTSPGSVLDAGLWGLARTFRIEHPELRLRSIECAAESLPEAVAACAAWPQEDELSVAADGTVRAARLRRGDSGADTSNLSVRPDATYVVSGGTGALGTVVARLLVERGAKHILLLARSAPGQASAPVLALREQARVEYLACDVADAGSVLAARDWLAQAGWPLVAGVAHAAGVLSDGTIPNQSPDKLRVAYGAKVHGAIHLHDAFAPSDFMLLFSSAAATFGSAGQASYAAANATLDALAASWARAGEQALSVQWGAWSDAGMATRQDGVRRAEASGFGTISDALGTAVLAQLLAAAKRGVVCVSPIDWTRLTLDLSLIARFRPRRAVQAAPRGDAGHRIEDLVEMVRLAALEAIGHAVDEDEPLMANGLDSLAAVVLAQSLSQQLGLSLGSVFALNYPSIREMAEALLVRLQEAGAADQASVPAPAAPPRVQRTEEPIAIVGSACRLPGAVGSPEAFWEMLLAGTDCVGDIPASRFDIDEVYDADPDAVGTSYTRRGAFMDDVEFFDHDFFGISLAEARAMDPHQRLLLEVAYQAFDSAGYDKKRLRGSATGVFVGVANQDWTVLSGDDDARNPFFGAGVSSSITSNRISHLLGLTGPSMTLDTACSSSLVALDLAVEKLRSGVCAKALVGGVNVMLHHRTFVGCCAAKMLSIRGRSAAFDASADGYCRGEGAGAVVLKRLSDALADGDEVLAVIRGTAVNQDGRSASLTAPSGPAQEAVIRQALDAAGLAGRDVDYVECHGTGTPLGDPIEVEALKNVLGGGRDKPVVLGAVKTNIGHLEGAAGVVGLIKVVEVLRRRTAPGNVHFTTLNPKIDLSGFNAVIPTAPVARGASGEDRLVASISSFGFGGTNAHAVLESYAGTPSLRRSQRAPVRYAARFLPWRRLHHPFLGRQDGSGFVAALAGGRAAMWEDHRIGGQVLVPAASHITLLGGAALLKHAGNAKAVGIEVREVLMPRPLVVDGPSGAVRCVPDGARWNVLLERGGASEQVAGCQGTRVLGGADLHLSDVDVEDVMERCPAADIGALYEAMLPHGVQFGTGYRKLGELRIGEDEALARVRADHAAPEERALTLLHPATLDAGIQLLALCGMKTCGVCLPFSVTSARLFTVEDQPAELWAHARVSAASASSLEGTVTLFADTGEVYAELKGMGYRHVGAGGEVEDCLFETEWVTVPPTDTSAGPDGRHLLLTRLPLQANLPPAWHHAVAGETDLTPLLAGGWDSVALLGQGAEEDVALGLRLLQALATRPGGAPAIGQTVFATAPGSVLDAGLWGLARSFRIEHPELRLRSIECAAESLPQAVAACAAWPQEDELSVAADGTVRAARLRRGDSGADTSNLSVRPDATYVVSGGTGALGTVVAKLLVERGAKHVLLLARSAPGAASAPVLALREQARVEYLACDVADAGSVLAARDWLARAGWPLVAGVAHAAGVLSDGTIPNQSADKLRVAYGAKVHGAIHLHDAFAPSDFMLLFSSAAATFGSAGQASYAAANATLDALAASWARAGEQALSVQWGAWSDAGMATRQDGARRAEASGFGSISDALGTAVLAQLLAAAKRGVVCVSPIDWARIGFDMPLIARFRPRRVALAGAGHDAKDAGKPAGHTLAGLTAIVRRTAAASVGQQVADDEPLMASGLDSLGAVMLAHSLGQELGLSLGSLFALNHPTIRDMAGALLERVGQAAAPEEKTTTVESPAPRQRAQRSEEPIAIVASACRLPGDVNSPEDFWEMLLAGTDCVTDVPDSRFDIGEVYDPNPDAVGTSYTKRGAFMSEVDSFDHDFFGIPVSEARAMDPQQRLLLEVAYEAFHYAGYDKDSLRKAPIGVFVGQMNHDWAHMNNEEQLWNPYFAAGSSSSITSNRISYLLGLTGPSMTLDTACSSSLVTVDLAVEKLRSGVCSAALVGGVNVMLNHRSFVGCCAVKMLSPKGRSATFDAGADGYCRGEGVGAVVLKRLGDAIADGDEVLAVIRGTAVNQDGRSASLTAPNELAQEAVIRQALDVAGLDGRDVDYVECHGTGTPLGDPIEVEALKNVLGKGRDKSLVLGAVKTNIGHTEGAAGVIGLIKAVEVLRHRQAPGNVHFTTLNPKIDLDNFDAVIPTAPVALGRPGERKPLVAGVSSFGFGGTNAHVVLESWETPAAMPQPTTKNQAQPSAKLGAN